MFFEVAHASPNQIAIELSEQTWTYDELLTNVIRLAQYLRIKKGEIVYQYVDRSLEMVCGLLAIMYSGGAYCPLNPTDSSAHIRTLTESISSRYVLVHENTYRRFSTMIQRNIFMINIERILLTENSKLNMMKPESIKNDNPSFVVFSSDVNKRSIGIIHTHASLVANLQHIIQWESRFGDNVFQVVESSWIIHLFEILIPLIVIRSGTLVLLPPEDSFNLARFCKTIQNKQITVLFIDPFSIEPLLEYLESHDQPERGLLRNVRILWTLDGSVKAQYQSQISSFAPQARLYSMYKTIARERENELPQNLPRMIRYSSSPWIADRPDEFQRLNDHRCSLPLPYTNDTYCLKMGRPWSKTKNHLVPMKERKHPKTSVSFSDEAPGVRESDYFLNTDRISAVSIDSDTLPFPGLRKTAFCCFNQTTFPRYQCLKLVSSPWFERFTLFVILLNCITLGMYQPCPSNAGLDSSNTCSANLCFYLRIMDQCIFAYFTFEMFIRIVAMGFIGKDSYLAESWNRLDCFIVITGWIELLLPGDNLSLSSIRTVRVLRPLRAINTIPSMRILVMLLLDTLPMLGNVLLLYFFLFAIFGIIAVQLWKGVLRNRCFLQLNSSVISHYYPIDETFSFHPFYVPTDDRAFICSNSFAVGVNRCSDIPKYHQENVTCTLGLNSLLNQTSAGCINWNQYYQTCASSDENPYSGAINFDNIVSAWLAIFQIVSLENWVEIMYYIQDAHSFWNWIYFLALTIIGSFFMMNICLAVISAQFSVTKKRETQLMAAERERFLQSTNSISSSIDQKSCWEVIMIHIERFFKRLLRRKNKKAQGNHAENNVSDRIQSSSELIVHDGSHRNKERQHESQDSSCCSSPCRRILARYVHSKYFELIIFCAIIINTLSMSVEYHGQPQRLTNILEHVNYVFVALFTIEMILKILADGCWTYVKSPLNIFDCTIVIISLVELYGAQNSGLSVLRTFRLLRVLKLAQFTPTLRKQFLVMMKTLDNVATFLLLLLLFVFIFSVLGMHLFGGQFCTIQGFNKTSRQQFTMNCRCCTCVEVATLKNSSDFKDVTCEFDRPNFDTLRGALLTVFQILTQEDWNEVLYKAMEKTGSWSALYFIALMIFGNYVLLNLLVAILVEGFVNEKENEVPGEIVVDSAQDDFIQLSNVLQHTMSPYFDHSSTSSPDEYLTAPGSNTGEESSSESPSLQLQSSLADISLSMDDSSSTSSYATVENTKTHADRVDVLLPIHEEASFRSSHSDPKRIKNEDYSHNPKNSESCCSCYSRLGFFSCFRKRHNYSLYLFSPTNRFRIALQQLTEEKSFDTLVLICIGLNCITLAMERPSIAPHSLERKFLTWGNYVFTVVFTIEMIIKILADGLVIGRNTYLRNNWNRMDGFLVLISIVDLIIANRSSLSTTMNSNTTSRILGILRVLRILRALRPLRLINRAPGLKLVIESLLSSIKPIGNVIVICCVFFVIFGILGVQLFKGQFYHCDGPQADTVTTKQECLSLPEHHWINQQYNFDNLFQALLTLFVLSSKDAWVSIMYNGIDAVGVDMQPKRNHSEGKFVYFVAFILMVGFFVVNVFVGVIVENFQSCREELESQQEAQTAINRQKELEYQQIELCELEESKRFSPWRKHLFDLCKSKAFDITIAIVIVLNVITMSVEFYQMPMWLEKFLEYCNYLFTFIFFMEFLLKIIAFGISQYFRDNWNRFDAFVVFLSIIGIVIDKMNHKSVLPINPTLIRVMRLLRIARILRLLKMAKGIQALIDTVIEAFPQVGNLSLLFFLIFFIFAALGVELFGKIHCTDEQPCEGLNKHANFQNFGVALLTLYRVATGDNWNAIMTDTMRQDESMDEEKSSLVMIISPIYFVIFVLSTQFVLVNLVVAVLLKKLEDSAKKIEDEQRSLLTREERNVA
ncbi:unnamed protein product [Adineta ricciae]|nr:unnamed protein product [Adineta ricciae]